MMSQYGRTYQLLGDCTTYPNIKLVLYNYGPKLLRPLLKFFFYKCRSRVDEVIRDREGSL